MPGWARELRSESECGLLSGWGGGVPELDPELPLEEKEGG